MKYVIFNTEKVYPSKIVCIGRNYVDHIMELGNNIPEQMVIFLKPNSAISTDIISGKEDTVHYEGEISFLINSGEISGIGFGLDLTKRGVQKSLKTNGLPWERAKAFDNSAVFSDFVAFNGSINDLRLELFINGKLTQSGSCELMLNKPEAILNEVKSFLTFEDGDLIMTGTPKGVGPVNQGDEFTGKIYDGEKLLIETSWIAR
ncbi:fumarylacetoacetate hydrolase family protein [Bacteroidota bacterium]